MIEVILRDSQLHPGVFFWSGALSTSAVEEWERKQSLFAPEDLKQLWSLKGGGDLFESETILQPFGTKEYDLIEPVSSVFWGKGLSTDYCVFHTGRVESVFRKSDGALFSLGSPDISQMSQFEDLDEWYVRTLRSIYWERYGLEALA
jgi:hypothetical protein